MLFIKVMAFIVPHIFFLFSSDHKFRIDSAAPMNNLQFKTQKLWKVFKFRVMKCTDWINICTRLKSQSGFRNEQERKIINICMEKWMNTSESRKKRTMNEQTHLLHRNLRMFRMRYKQRAQQINVLDAFVSVYLLYCCNEWFSVNIYSEYWMDFGKLHSENVWWALLGCNFWVCSAETNGKYLKFVSYLCTCWNA